MDQAFFEAPSIAIFFNGFRSYWISFSCKLIGMFYLGPIFPIAIIDNTSKVLEFPNLILISHSQIPALHDLSIRLLMIPKLNFHVPLQHHIDGNSNIFHHVQNFYLILPILRAIQRFYPILFVSTIS